MTLDGLERVIRAAVPAQSRVNFVRYADDFIITGKSKRLLETNVRPAVEAFLAERGLSLSEEKTVITHIRRGFTFLGQTFRKTGRVLHITPAIEGIRALAEKVRTLIRAHVGAPMPILIRKLNQMLRGWGNYHRHVVASEAFGRIDRYVHEQLWHMVRRRHSGKSWTWLFRHYWTAGGRDDIFAVNHKTDRGWRVYQVVRLSALTIKRYIKVRADANPYRPEDAGYFHRRRHDKRVRILPTLSARHPRTMFA
jgi:RNA-directed DNA polymerase